MNELEHPEQPNVSQTDSDGVEPRTRIEQLAHFSRRSFCLVFGTPLMLMLGLSAGCSSSTTEISTDEGSSDSSPKTSQSGDEEDDEGGEMEEEGAEAEELGDDEMEEEGPSDEDNNEMEAEGPGDDEMEAEAEAEAEAEGPSDDEMGAEEEAGGPGDDEMEAEAEGPGDEDNDKGIGNSSGNNGVGERSSAAGGLGQKPRTPEGSAEYAVIEVIWQVRGNCDVASLEKVISPDAKGVLADLRAGKLSDTQQTQLKETMARVQMVGRPRIIGSKKQIALRNSKGQILQFKCARKGKVYLVSELHVVQSTGKRHH